MSNVLPAVMPGETFEFDISFLPCLQKGSVEEFNNRQLAIDVALVALETEWKHLHGCSSGNTLPAFKVIAPKHARRGKFADCEIAQMCTMP